MKALLPALCLLSAFLSTALSVKCRTCTSVLKDHEYEMYPTMEEMGKKAFCSDVALDYKVEDNCASLFVLVTKFDGTDRYYFIRTALRSEECNRTGSISAPRMNISYSTSCCSLNNCLPLRSPLPPKKNTTRNGILCPACYSEEQKCMATHSIECTGEETSCMTYVSHSAFGEPPVSYSGGCASRDVCGHARSLPFLVDVYTAHNISCAPENSTNLKPGHFLWCITCFTYNSDDCWGDAILCSHSDDACVQEHIRTIHDGWDVTELTKRCGTSKECGRVGSIRSAEKTMLVNTSCCYGSKCRTPATTLPSISDRDNGLICPGCYVSKSDRCTRFNNIKCTGNETRCMRYVKTERYVTESLHGCTTDEICEAGPRMIQIPGRYLKNVKHNITCNSAKAWRSAIHSLYVISFTVLCLLKA